jgi:hypothetical protein
MTQTAVQWLFEELWETRKDRLIWNAILKQALTMERTQIIEAFDAACEDPDRIGIEYYAETFNTK